MSGPADYLPSPEAIGRIKADAAEYEAARVVAAKAVRWRVPLVLGLFGVIAAAAVVATWKWIGDPDSFYPLAAGLALLFGGQFAWRFAHRPATLAQENYRSRLLPILFRSIDNFSHARGAKPKTFAYLPVEATGAYSSSRFDDVIAGKSGDLEFELFELRLTLGKASQTVFHGAVLAFALDRPLAAKFVINRHVGRMERLGRSVFGDRDFKQVKSGEAALDGEFEFRAENVAEAIRMLDGGLTRALQFIRDVWPERSIRIALAGQSGFLMLPSNRDLFELPGIATPLDFDRHLAPIVADMAKILEIGRLVAKAVKRS